MPLRKITKVVAVTSQMRKVYENRWKRRREKNSGGYRIYEPHREKTGVLPRRKQRRRSASR